MTKQNWMKDNWKKLRCLLFYKNSTLEIKLTISVLDSNFIKWLTDSSYIVNPDICSHTDSTIMLGRGSIRSFSSKQEINSRSSTEAKLITTNDILGQVIWTRNFFEGQGYDVKSPTVFQGQQVSDAT